MDGMLTSLLQPGVPVLEKIIRPVVVYVFLVIGFRLAGKRELAQLNPFDLIVLLTISNTVQNAIIGNDNSLSGGLIGATTLLLVNYLVVRWAFRHPAVERLVEGAPTVLVQGGRVLDDRLAQELITRAELALAAHRQGYLSLDDVDTAILDPGGIVMFEPKKHATRVARHHELVGKLDAIQHAVEQVRRDLTERTAGG